MKSIKSYPVVLSIAGSDSSGGAGIQADLKTFSALGVYGATAITAVTAQNTVGVHAQCALPPQMVYDQIVAVVDDLHPSVVKIGMLSNSEIVCAVANALGRYALPVVLDPVIVSSSGHRLLSEEAVDVIKEKLLDDHVADLVGTAFTFLLSVCSANEVFLAMFPSASSHLVELCSAIGTEQHSR